MRLLAPIAIFWTLLPCVALSAEENKVVELQSRIWAGRTLAEAPTLDCDVDLCRAEPEGTALREMINLKAGQVLAIDDVKGAWNRLMRTGYFREVTPNFTVSRSEDAPIKLQFVCTGHVVITDLNIEYASWTSWFYPKQFITEIRKRLPLKRGGSFPLPRADGTYTPKDAATLKQYEDRIVSLYSQQGYLGTSVQIIPNYYGPRGKKVRVTVRVSEGNQPDMGQVLFRGADAYPYWKLVEPLSTGERADFWRELFGLFGVGKYKRKELKEDLKQVESRYRDDGWVGARVRLESEVIKEAGKVYPKVRIIEGRHLQVSFTGNRKLSDSELKEVLTFKETGAFDDTELEESKNRIREAYQAIAHYYVDVTATRERLAEGRYRIEFTIEEGPRVYIRRVDIVGNRHVSDALIKAAMETEGVAEDGVLNALALSPGIVQHAQIINDLNAVRALYQDLGLPGLQFRCANPNLTPQEWTTIRQLRRQSSEPDGPNIDPSFFNGQFDVWSANPLSHHCYEVIPDDDPRLVVLRVELNEGQQTRIGRVNLDEIIDQMDEQMQDEARLLLEKQGFLDEYGRWIGDVGFNRNRLRAVRGFLLRYLHQEGYLSATVNTECRVQRNGRVASLRCDEEDLYGLSIEEVRFQLIRGPRTQVSGILLRGNLDTSDRILMNELLMEPGQPLGSDELFLSQANLRSLGIFDAVNLQYISHDTIQENVTQSSAMRTKDSDRDATIIVTVEETPAKLLDLYFGLQYDSSTNSAELPVLYNIETTIRHRNLFGQALEAGIGANHSNSFSSPEDVYGDEAVWRAGPFLKNRRFLGTRLDLAIESLYERGQTAQGDAYRDVVTLDATVGFDFYNLSYPFRWGQGLRASLSTEFSRERVRPLSRLGERPPFGEANNSISVTPGITWDRRDSPLHPTRGWLAIAQAELLFPKLDGLDDLPFKTSLTTQYVHSFLKRRLIVVPQFRVGSVWTQRNDSDLRSGFLFKAGGDGVTLPVRGYADASIEACRATEQGRFGDLCEEVYAPGLSESDDFAVPATVGGRAMLLGGLELRFPTFVLDDFWFSAFSDFGAIAPTWRALDSSRFKTSVGGGLRWLLSGQIPLRIDVAYPLSQTPFSPQEVRFHVNIFYTL